MRLLTKWDELHKVQVELDPIEFIKYLRWQRRWLKINKLRRKFENGVFDRFGISYHYTSKPNGKYGIRIRKEPKIK